MEWPKPISKEEFDKICQGMQDAYKNNYFDGMFTGECKQIVELPNKEKLLASISSDMVLRKSFFLKIYGYEIGRPGFAEIALKALEDVGCSLAREHYNRIVSEYETVHEEKIKEGTKGYLKKCQEEYERFIKKQEMEGDENGAEQKPVGDWHRFKGFPSIL